MKKKSSLIFALILSLALCLPGNAQSTFQGGTVTDGISQDIIDSTVRISRRSGRGYSFGSGAIMSETDTTYRIISNHHVTLGKGTTNTYEFWNNGRLADKEQLRVARSFFKNGKSVDVSITDIPKSSLRGPMPVIELASYEYIPKAGDKVIMVGCSDGRWPRGRTGFINKMEGDLIYYSPTSIGGDSGSCVYAIINGKPEIIGLTAWAIKINGKEYGLAMSHRRIYDIAAGRTNSGFNLPVGAYQIETAIKHPDKLPEGAYIQPHIKNTAAFIQDCPDGVCPSPGTFGSQDPFSGNFNQSPTPDTPKADDFKWRIPFGNRPNKPDTKPDVGEKPPITQTDELSELIAINMKLNNILNYLNCEETDFKDWFKRRPKEELDSEEVIEDLENTAFARLLDRRLNRFRDNFKAAQEARQAESEERLATKIDSMTGQLKQISTDVRASTKDLKVVSKEIKIASKAVEDVTDGLTEAVAAGTEQGGKRWFRDLRSSFGLKTLFSWAFTIPGMLITLFLVGLGLLAVQGYTKPLGLVWGGIAALAKGFASLVASLIGRFSGQDKNENLDTLNESLLEERIKNILQNQNNSEES